MEENYLQTVEEKYLQRVYNQNGIRLHISNELPEDNRANLQITKDLLINL